MKRNIGLPVIFLFLVLLGVLLVTITTNSVYADQDKAIIIDHTCTDITQIPESAINQAKATLHIGYGHTSHGSQLTTGMTGLVSFANGGGLGLSLPADIFAWNNGGTGGALDLHDKFMDGDLGDPDRTTWASRTREYLNTPANSDVNVIIWAWCWQADTTEGNIDLYLSLMNQLEMDYPVVTFVYMTGRTNGTGETGNLHLRNQQIRNYCETNGKVLYDFYDIECYDPDDNYFGDKLVNDFCDYDSDGDGIRDANWAIEWQSSHTEGVDWYTCVSAHSQPLNANRKAYAAWWLWARVAGWNPGGFPSLTAGFSGTPISGTVPLQVSFTDLSTGEIDSRSWDFDNDGTIDSTAQNPTFTYVDSGTYTVVLRVAGPGGADTETKTDYIKVTSPLQTPVADFSGAPRTGTAPLEVSFTDLSTGEIDHWSWDFDNDGTIDSTGDNPTFTFVDPGTYTIALEVSGSGGNNINIKTDYITVNSDSGGGGDSGDGGCFISASAYAGRGK